MKVSKCKSYNVDRILTVLLEVLVYARVFELRKWDLQAMSHPFYIKARLFFSLALLLLNPLMPGSNKRSYILKQTCSFWLQVFLSVYDLLLPLGIKRLKFSNLQSKMLPKCFFINFACKTVILKLAPDLTVGFIYLNEIHFKSSI